ncbi:hypothetical protein [Arthrobacter sp. Leaf141]|uniref:hypothetical protein n=1 Tax=Arthrobacter sp. Leaf141 TaxID=1736273 RepID=UPI000A9C70CA|nr:hypothetical protein [Arthrobacter sp. Leaf141]
MRKVDEEVFVITYDGPALRAGRMNVKDLAPALLALGDLIERTQELTQPESNRPAVHISATHEGSFIVDLIIMADVPNLVKQALELFNSREVTAALNAHDIVAAVSGAVLLLVTSNQRRKIKKREQGAAPGMSKITFTDGTVIEVPMISESLIRDLDARRHLKDVVEPLTKEGITSFVFDSRRSKATVQNTDLDAFELPQLESEIINETVSEMAIQPVSIAFQDNNKWKVSDGSRVMWAAIEDTAFLTKVENNEERFGKGDILKVQMKTTQRRTPDGNLRNDYSIVEVLRHIPAGRQLALPFDDVVEEEASPAVETPAPPRTALRAVNDEAWIRHVDEARRAEHEGNDWTIAALERMPHPSEDDEDEPDDNGRS